MTVQKDWKENSSPLEPSNVEPDRAIPDVGSANNERIFNLLFERHSGEVLRYAIRCTGRREIAEELASEAFLKMFQNLQHIDPARAGAWLTTAVKNLATDYWRKQAVERKYSSAVASPTVESPRQQDFEQFLQSPALKAEHRVCLTLHYIHGMERKEICSHTGLSDNQVKSSLQYGLKLLRQQFGVAE